MIHIWQAACRVWVHGDGKEEDPEFAQVPVKPPNAKSTDLMLAKWDDGAVWAIEGLTVEQFDGRHGGSDGSAGGYTTTYVRIIYIYMYIYTVSALAIFTYIYIYVIVVYYVVLCFILLYFTFLYFYSLYMYISYFYMCIVYIIYF